MLNRTPGASASLRTRSLVRVGIAALGTLLLAACAKGPEGGGQGPRVRSLLLTPLAELNDGPCKPGQVYGQEPLGQPVRIGQNAEDTIETELVVRIRERCVPVWNTTTREWEMQTLKLRTYGFPRNPGTPITDADADDPNSPNIAWSAPGPTFVMSPASRPGASDGTRFKMRLYNRMPHDGDPHACEPSYKCNTEGPDPGVDPATGKCKVPPDPTYKGVPEFVPNQTVDGKVIEPPNCFHGNNSTNFHFHGFHVSPQPGQDFVGLELRPPLPADVAETSMPAHGPHGDHGTVAYGHFDFNVDPLRYTQPPGTHWYHAHKHGSTALQVLNGLVGAFEVRGAFDRQLGDYFEKEGGGALTEQLIVIQQLQERQPGLGGVDQTGSVLANGQANPIVRMERGEIQRWRFIGATMQASAAVLIGFPDVVGRKNPELRQIAMDGVQFSPENYGCQPFLNNPNCSLEADDSAFDEPTAFELAPGNRVDLLIRAPMEPGVYCLVYNITASLQDKADEQIRGALLQRAAASASACGLGPNAKLGPLLTLVVEAQEKPMAFPDENQFPPMAPYLKDIPEVTEAELQHDLYYEMMGQGNLNGTQFWITQQKYDPSCANETLVLNQPQQWTLWNNSGAIAHPFHIHQNPFQLLAQSDRVPSEYSFPVWRDTLAIPKATLAKGEKNARCPTSDPEDPTNPWGYAQLRYVAKEFTGSFVNHCHILGHEDRGMMHATQATCADGQWATTGPVPPDGHCDAEGFCTSDCEQGSPMPATPACAPPPDQRSDWLAAYGAKCPAAGT